MQTLYGVEASNIELTAQKRLIRVVYGQSQITPYAGVIDPSLRESNGTIRIPKNTDKTPSQPLKRSAEAYTYPEGGTGGLVPGTCMVKTKGEAFAVAAGRTGEQVFGLLGQWVGGPFDNIKGSNEISVWQGRDAVVDLLAPAFNSTGLSAAVTAYNETPGQVPVYLYPGTDGRLTYEAGALTTVGPYSPVITGSEAAKELYPVAEVIELVNAGVVRVRLLV